MSVTNEPNRVTAEVRAGIEELVAEHAWVLDHGDPRLLPELYTDEGQLLGLGDPWSDGPPCNAGPTGERLSPNGPPGTCTPTSGCGPARTAPSEAP